MKLFSLGFIHLNSTNTMFSYTKKFSSQGGLALKFHRHAAAHEATKCCSMTKQALVSTLNFCGKNHKGQLLGFVLLSVRIKIHQGSVRHVWPIQ